MGPIEKFEVNGLMVSIFRDDNAESPREWDNVGTMVCFHRRYKLGDKVPGYTPESLQEFIEESGAIALPLYLMDHSGLSISTGDFGCPWDSGQVGYIYVTKEKLLKEFSASELTDDLRTRAIQCLNDEVKVYDQYLSGEVYGYVIERVIPASAPCETCNHAAPKHMEHVDSCWGFFGMEYCKQEALASAEHAAKGKKS